MKTKKISKLEALYKCYLLWDWLSKNPNMEKADWPGWEKESQRISNNCFACEHSVQHNYKCDYKGCIIPIFKLGGCIKYERPYKEWENKINRSGNARKIATSAYKEYKRLGGKK